MSEFDDHVATRRLASVYRSAVDDGDADAHIDASGHISATLRYV